MSYTTVEDALKTLLQAVTGYSTANVTEGDYRILGTGQTKAMVLQPGAFRRTNSAPGVQVTDWTVNVELFIPFQDEISTIAAAIRTEVAAIIAKLDAYPTLNRTSGVLLGAIESGDEPEVWSVGSRRWWRQLMRVTIKEQSLVATSE